jgi:hypothetical protein
MESLTNIVPVGTLEGMTVFINPLEKEPIIILGRNSKEGEPGVFWGEYSNKVHKMTVVDDKSFVPYSKTLIRSRKAIVPLGLKPEDQYYAFKLKLSNETGFLEKTITSIFKPE